MKMIAVKEKEQCFKMVDQFHSKENITLHSHTDTLTTHLYRIISSVAYHINFSKLELAVQNVLLLNANRIFTLYLRELRS